MIHRISRTFSSIFLLLILLPLTQTGVLASGQFPGNQVDVVHKDFVERVCRVRSVHDGDSMRVECPGAQKSLRVRLDKIDAPELDQAHGIKSRNALRSMCPAQSSVRIHDFGADTYGRRLGRVFCKDKDVNAEMVRTGAAWVYKHHAKDDTQLNQLQSRAQSKKLGLWAGPKKPIAPWTFRYQQRNKN